MKRLEMPFKEDVFKEFIKIIGWETIDKWIEFCERNKLISHLKATEENKLKDDWIWFILLPLISQAYNLCIHDSNRKIIGISALPGTGKSTLGVLIEKLSLNLNLKVAVISIDDFYWPKKEMDSAVINNPWKVSRGFPGSHSVKLMKEKLINWKKTGKLNVPTFDKSLNNGLGDRSYWRNETADLVVIEGWFLGVKPSSSKLKENIGIYPPLSSSEILYRLKIQNNLKCYEEVWNLIDIIWHLKPEKFNFLNLWKKQQEREMFLKKGVALSNDKFLSFLRMLNVSLPYDSFDDINADFRFEINQDRKLINLYLL